MTISEIAKLAGVSSATVSRYFNDGYLSEEKRAAIKSVVEETGYRPSIQAQMLRMKRTKTIVVIVPRIESASGASVISGVKKIIEENGYRMLLACYDLDINKEIEFLDLFDDSQVDGIILLASVNNAAVKKAVTNHSLPVVVIGQRITGCHCVYHDDYNAMCYMVSHIIEKGRNNIAYIGVNKKDKSVGADRIKAFEDSVTKYGLEECRNQIVIKGFGIDSGYEGTKELVEKYMNLDAIICATDRIALGAIKYLRDNDISVPNQIMITGQGDSIISQVSYPSITTLKYYYEESGIKGATMLLDIIENKNVPVVEIKLGYELVIRESTCN